MLRVVENRFPVILKITDGVAYHPEILVGFRAQDFLHMQQPGLPDDRHHRRLRFQDQPHQIVLLHRDTLAAGHAERRDFGMPPFAFAGLFEEFHVLRITPRPAAFNVMNPERIELLGDAQFVHRGEIDAFALRTIAQGRVIDFHLGFHKLPVKTDG